MGVYVVYLLTQEGQRKSLKAATKPKKADNRAGKAVQIQKVPPELLDNAFLLEDVRPDGRCFVFLGGPEAFCWKGPLNLTTALGRSSDKKIVGRYDVGERSVSVGRFTYPAYAIKPTLVDPPQFDAPLTTPAEIEAALSAENVRRAVVAESRAAAEAEVTRLDAEVADLKEKANRAAADEQKRVDEVYEARCAEEAAERARRDAALRARVAAWIEEHGSDRLKLILADGFLDDSRLVYYDEWLAKERPGWVYRAPDFLYSIDFPDVRNPSAEVLQWRREVVRQYPNAQLRWATRGNDPADKENYLRSYVMLDSVDALLDSDRTVLLFPPDSTEEEDTTPKKCCKTAILTKTASAIEELLSFPDLGKDMRQRLEAIQKELHEAIAPPTPE